MKFTQKYLLGILAIILCIIITTPVSAAAKIKIQSITPVSVTLKAGDRYQMPAKVTAVMSNNTRQQVPVRWSGGVNTNREGTQTVFGTVTGTPLKAKLTARIFVPYMSDIMQPYYADFSYDVNNTRTMAGVTYTKGYAIRVMDHVRMDFNLQGRYHRITAQIGQVDGYNDGHITIDILGDGAVIDNVILEPGDMPKPLDLDVSGVTKLGFSIVCTKRVGDLVPDVLIANPKIR